MKRSCNRATTTKQQVWEWSLLPSTHWLSRRPVAVPQMALLTHRLSPLPLLSLLSLILPKSFWCPTLILPERCCARKKKKTPLKATDYIVTFFQIMFFFLKPENFYCE